MALAPDDTFDDRLYLLIVTAVGAEFLQVVAHVVEDGLVEAVKHLNLTPVFILQGVAGIDVAHGRCQLVHLTAVDGGKGSIGHRVVHVERVESRHRPFVRWYARCQHGPHRFVGDANSHHF